MSRVWIALGGNVGDRAAVLGRAVGRLETRGVRVARVSHAYETAPERPEDGAPFLNAVLEGETDLTPHELLSRLRATEAECGRALDHGPGPRACDLDLLAWNDRVLDEAPELVLPHPRMHRRDFVLVPLCELDPGWKHPVLERTAGELLEACEAAPGRVRHYGALPWAGR